MSYATHALNPNLAMRSGTMGAKSGCCDDCSCNCVASGCCPDCVAPGISSARRTGGRGRAMSGFGAQAHGWNQGGLAGMPKLPTPRRRGLSRYLGRRGAMGDTGGSPCGCVQVDPSDSSVTDAQIAQMNQCNASCNASAQSGNTAGQTQATSTGLLAGAASVVGRLFGGGAPAGYPYQTGPDLTTILLLAGLGIGAVYFITKD